MLFSGPKCLLKRRNNIVSKTPKSTSTTRVIYYLWLVMSIPKVSRKIANPVKRIRRREDIFTPILTDPEADPHKTLLTGRIMSRAWAKDGYGGWNEPSAASLM